MNDCMGCRSMSCILKTILKPEEICPCSYCLVKGICNEFCILVMDFLRKIEIANSSLTYMSDKVIRMILQGSQKFIYLYKDDFKAELLSRTTGDGNNVINRPEFFMIKTIDTKEKNIYEKYKAIVDSLRLE